MTKKPRKRKEVVGKQKNEETMETKQTTEEARQFYLNMLNAADEEDDTDDPLQAGWKHMTTSRGWR